MCFLEIQKVLLSSNTLNDSNETFFSPKNDLLCEKKIFFMFSHDYPPSCQDLFHRELTARCLDCGQLNPL